MRSAFDRYLNVIGTSEMILKKAPNQFSVQEIRAGAYAKLSFLVQQSGQTEKADELVAMSVNVYEGLVKDQPQVLDYHHNLP